MSKVLNIIVEGPTETEFVTQCLRPYFNNKGFFNIRPIGIETSPGFKGGDVRYSRYKKHIQTILRGQEDLLVTSLIDFYRLRNDFPKFDEAQKIQNNIVQKVDFLEQACFEDINDHRFIPYIQLHEFEGLLFTKIDGFNDFPDLAPNSRQELEQIIHDFPNPELINEGATTAPSKRLLRLIPDYQKPFHGNYIALTNGLDAIFEKCPRFNAWIETLVERMNG